MTEQSTAAQMIPFVKAHACGGTEAACRNGAEAVCAEHQCGRGRY